MFFVPLHSAAHDPLESTNVLSTIPTDALFFTSQYHYSTSHFKSSNQPPKIIPPSCSVSSFSAVILASLIVHPVEFQTTRFPSWVRFILFHPEDYLHLLLLESELTSLFCPAPVDHLVFLCSVQISPAPSTHRQHKRSELETSTHTQQYLHSNFSRNCHFDVLDSPSHG